MERKSYIDYLRLAATLAVVALHVSAQNWYNTDVNSFSWQSFNFYDSLVRWSVPVFVMISGSLFLNRDISLKRIYGKYVLKMLIVFVVWSLFYALAARDTLENGLVYSLKTHAYEIMTGHYHMWFLLMIIGLYMCIPFYRKLVAEASVMRYFLLLAFVFTFLLPWLIQIVSDYAAGDSEPINRAISAVNSDLSTMGMNMVLGYSFYFVFGYYLDGLELRKKHRVIIYILGLLGFAFTVLADADLALRTQRACDKYYGYFKVNVFCEALCVHTWFKYRRYRSGRLNKTAGKIAGYCFGVYLVHAFVMEKFTTMLNFNTLSFNAVASVPVVSVAVFVCSLAVSAAMNHIPIIRKYCV